MVIGARLRAALRSRRSEPGATELELAAELHRFAVLLGVGLAPHRAWRLIGNASGGRVAALVGGLPPGADPVPTLLAAAAGSGPSSVSAADARAGPALAALAAALRVAGDCGAPLAPTLEAATTRLRWAAEAARRRDLALAGPIAGSRIVAALPFTGVLLAQLCGFQVLGVLVGSLPGRVCFAAGLVFAVAAVLWMRALVRRATPAGDDPGLAAELTAIALAGGAPVGRAFDGVAAALAEAGLAPPGPEVAELLEFAAAAGAPPAALLRAEADEARRSAAVAAERAAVVLGVRLMLPLGLCVLPAFVALGVAPIVIALVGSVALG